MLPNLLMLNLFIIVFREEVGGEDACPAASFGSCSAWSLLSS